MFLFFLLSLPFVTALTTPISDDRGLNDRFYFSNDSDILNGIHAEWDADFLWGFASAAFQIEGAVAEGGRGMTIWDEFVNKPGIVADGTSANVTCDSYHRWKEDVALLKLYGASSYRFSIAWSRIIPTGSRFDQVNEEGILYYSNLIDELIANDIIPFVTLYHWDLPSSLMARYDGLLSIDEFPLDFANYAQICFDRFGDRVKYWITFNEPYVSAKLGYGEGIHAPGRSSDRSKSQSGDTSTEPWIVGHAILIAHGLAVDIYRRNYQQIQNGKISITLNSDWAEPFTNSTEDQAAAKRYLDFYFAWFADPIYFGDYPRSMRDQLGSRLPHFTTYEKNLIKGSIDFFALNHYTSRFISNRNDKPEMNDMDGNIISHVEDRFGKPIGILAQSDWLYVVPWGIRKLLNNIALRYNNPPIYITENGCSEPLDHQSVSSDIIQDKFRENYFTEYIQNVREALNDGVNVKGYFAWSLLDNFEWTDGLNIRFGSTFVNFTTGHRSPKSSAFILKSLFSRMKK